MKKETKTNTYNKPTLAECIGKIDITDKTPQAIAGALYNTTPHTLKVNGRYI